MITLLKLSPYTGEVAAPSPNYDARKSPAIQGIVLHATEDHGDETRALSWLRSPNSRVSSHLLVGRSGRVTRLVGDRQRAWHAGRSWWRGTGDVNSITLGIEIANRNDGEPYTDIQYRRVADIVAHYCNQGLSLNDVVSHAEIAQGRKTDPFGWDWDRFTSLVRQQSDPVIDQPIVAAIPAPQSVQALPGAAAMKALPPVPSAKQLPSMAAAPPMNPASANQPVATNASKPALRSRTLWLNLVTVIAGAGMLMADSFNVAHNVGIHLPEQITKWALFLVGVLNIVLRLVTKRPITCGENSDCQPAKLPKGFPDRPLFLRQERQKARVDAGYGARSARKALPVA